MKSECWVLINNLYIFFQESSQGNNNAAIVDARDQGNNNNQNTEESTSQVSEEQNSNNDNTEAEEALNSIVEADNDEQEQTAATALAATTAASNNINNNNAMRKIARKRINSVARTPLTPASTTLLTSGSPVFRTVAAVPQFAAAPLRGAVVQRGPLTYSLAGAVSSGYYSYPGYGVAYEF